MTDKQDRDKPLSLHPLSFEEALRAAMQIRPPTETGEKKKRQGRKKKKDGKEPKE